MKAKIYCFRLPNFIGSILRLFLRSNRTNGEKKRSV